MSLNKKFKVLLWTIGQKSRTLVSEDCKIFVKIFPLSIKEITGDILTLQFGTTGKVILPKNPFKNSILRLNQFWKPKFLPKNSTIISNGLLGNLLKNCHSQKLTGVSILLGILQAILKNFSFQLMEFGLLMMKMPKYLLSIVLLLEDGLVTWEEIWTMFNTRERLLNI